jgi:hypothetical protein
MGGGLKKVAYLVVGLQVPRFLNALHPDLVEWGNGGADGG